MGTSQCCGSAAGNATRGDPARFFARRGRSPQGAASGRRALGWNLRKSQSRRSGFAVFRARVKPTINFEVQRRRSATADAVSLEVRSRMMADIRGKDTCPEMILRRDLHAREFRYRLPDRRLPGTPRLSALQCCLLRSRLFLALPCRVPVCDHTGDPAETATATDEAQAGHAARLCPNGKPFQAVSQSNPTTLRSARLNSTPIR